MVSANETKRGKASKKLWYPKKEKKWKKKVMAFLGFGYGGEGQDLWELALPILHIRSHSNLRPCFPLHSPPWFSLTPLTNKTHHNHKTCLISGNKCNDIAKRFNIYLGLASRKEMKKRVKVKEVTFVVGIDNAVLPWKP